MADSALPDVINGANVNAAINSLQSGGAAYGSWETPTNYIIGGWTTYPYRPNPTEAAFKIVAKLMEREIVGELTVSQFVALVNDVAEIVRTT